MKRRGFLISAPQSGSGKTTVSLAIMAAFIRRGLTVIPFKCGPDFIDPGYHRLITGSNSINLDGWMCSPDFIQCIFKRPFKMLPSIVSESITIIEGAMGLFDGIDVSSNIGSSAQIASITGTPVVLVVNAKGMAASVAPVVKGFSEYDSNITIAGVIFNNVGSASHSDLLCRVISDKLPDISVFGCIPKNESLMIPSRHLGLVTADDNPLSDKYIRNLAEFAEQHLDLDKLALLQITPCQPDLINDSLVSASLPNNLIINNQPKKNRQEITSNIRIAVAQDTAFSFVYEDNLRLLREAGAMIASFSPLNDSELPKDISGIYLPGGYPEIYAKELSNNKSMIEAIKKAVEADMPVYAECGGLIYLTNGIESFDNKLFFNFVGIFPVKSKMLSKRKALGYRNVKLLSDSILGNAHEILRGHEFHYSDIEDMPIDIKRLYQVTRQGKNLGFEGYCINNCLASYVHLHFGSNPKIATSFVDSCRSFMNSNSVNYKTEEAL